MLICQDISSCGFLYFLRSNFWAWCSTWCSDFKGWCKRCLPFVSYVYSKLKHNRDKTNKSFANPTLTHHHWLSCFVCAICTRHHNSHVQPFPGAKPQRELLVKSAICNTTKKLWIKAFILSVQLSMWGRIARNWNIKTLALRVVLNLNEHLHKPHKKVHVAFSNTCCIIQLYSFAFGRAPQITCGVLKIITCDLYITGSQIWFCIQWYINHAWFFKGQPNARNALQ